MILVETSDLYPAHWVYFAKHQNSWNREQRLENEPLMRIPKRCDYWFILPLLLTTSTFTWSSARVSQSEPRSKLYWLLMTNRTPTPSISSHYPYSRYQGTSGAAWRNCLWISGQWFHIMVKIVFVYKALAHIEIIDSRQNNRWMVVSL